MRRVMALLLLFFPFSAFALDITQYELVRENVVTKDASSEWDYVLTFKDTPFRVALGPRLNSKEQGDWFANAGLDEESLDVKWLAAGRLVQISWSTFPIGNGHYRAAAYVLLQVGDDKLTELVREAFQIYGSQGMNESQRTDVVYKWLPEEKQLIRQVSQTDCTWSETPIPLANDSGPGGFTREVRLTEMTTCKLEDDQLKVYSSDVVLDLGDRKVPAGEVAEVLVLYFVPRWSTPRGDGICTPKEREYMLRDLSLKEEDTCTGKIRAPGSEAVVLGPMTPQGDNYPFKRSR